MGTKQVDNKQWYMATVLETCAEFEVQMKKGLTPEQVKERTKSLKSSRTVSQFKTPRFSRVFWVLLLIMFALATSVYTLEETTAVLLYVLSACILAAFALAQQGFVKHILQVIAKPPSITNKVRRDGTLTDIAASALVTGDIVVLKKGDFIPANIRLLEVKDLLVDESESTGQAGNIAKSTLPLHKKTKPEEQKNMGFAGSFVVGGSGVGVVVELAEPSAIAGTLGRQHLNKAQRKRQTIASIAIFALGLSVTFWGVPLFAAIALSALLALSSRYYAEYWLQYITWTSLYDQVLTSGVRFADFKQLKAFTRIDTVFLQVPSDFAEEAAFIHQLQAELNIEVRPLIKQTDVKKFEAELNIADAALKSKDFMSATRAKKLKLLQEYQLLVGFDDVAIAEAVSLMTQAEHEVLWIDDSEVPHAAASIANMYISHHKSPSAMLQLRSALSYRQVSLKKLATMFDTVKRFKSMTAY